MFQATTNLFDRDHDHEGQLHHRSTCADQVTPDEILVMNILELKAGDVGSHYGADVDVDVDIDVELDVGDAADVGEALVEVDDGDGDAGTGIAGANAVVDVLSD